MQKKTIGRILVITAILVLAGVLAACAAPPAGTAPAAGGEAAATTESAAAPSGEKIKVGLSFSDFATERWANEEKILRKLLEDKGYEVLTQEANHDVKAQNDQIDNMVSQGVKALIVIAEDGDAVVTSVDKAADAGVAVIAYDRLIKSPKIAGYISFNNVEVGRQQADGVMKALDIANWDVAANGPARVVKLGGSPTDNNAILFRKGQDEVVDPLVKDGKVEIVADQWVDNWDAANALKLMENILTGANNDVDAVVASNDGTALGALQALKRPGSGRQSADLRPGRHRRRLQQHRQGRADGFDPQGHPQPVPDRRRHDRQPAERQAGRRPGRVHDGRADQRRYQAGQRQGAVPAGRAGQQGQRVRPVREERLPELRRCLPRHPGRSAPAQALIVVK